MALRKGKSTLKEDFLDTVSRNLEPGNSEGSSLLFYLQRTARQLNLSDFDVREILIEATVRGLSFIEERAERISNPTAWLRRVCSNIMYDMVREEKKNRSLKEKVSRDLEDRNLVEGNDAYFNADSAGLNEMYKSLDRATSLLSEADQEILKLRFHKDLTYKDIQELYFYKDGVSVSLPALRKRESRALQRLRSEFRKIYDTEKWQDESGVL